MALQIKQNPDVIERLQGIGIRAMDSIHHLIEELDEQLAEEQKQAEAVIPVAEIHVEEQPETPVFAEVVSPVAAEVTEELSAAEITEQEAVVEETEEIPEVEPSLEELFTLRPEVLDINSISDEDEGEDSGAQGKKKGKKKGKHTVVTYDPDRDMTVVQKKHKRGGGWDWEE